MNWPTLSIRHLWGWMLTLTPPAIARRVRPSFRSWQAIWIAVNDDEHIVSSVMLGSCRFSPYDTRFGMLAWLPANPILKSSMLALGPSSRYSLYITPTYTPTWPGRAFSQCVGSVARFSLAV